MANLEAKTKMSAMQLGLVVATTAIGAQIIIMPAELIKQTAQATWLSVLLGGFIFYGAAYLMIKLGKQYPEETMVEYMPRLWGRWGGSIVIWWFNLLYMLVFTLILCCFSRAITFIMFDRTPPAVVAMGILAASTYCALQDWGTILRVLQLLFFLAVPMLVGMWLLSLLNFQPENLLPLLPEDIAEVIAASLKSWDMYSGYEIILLLLPAVARGKISMEKAVGGAFGCMGLIFVSIMVIIVGVLTAASAKNAVYPAIMVIRAVELPGTFIERLENYLVIAWIPIVFDTLAVMLFIVAQVCMRHYHYADHRPWVMALAPLLYLGNELLSGFKTFEIMSKIATWLGLGFSLAVVPLTLILAWRRKRRWHERCG
ncbi:spore germination protein [Thermosinus carboxydivorans Nor1]|uniref:Spore germination protein n=1 Tax=Thermosinus carboxydivorans Nor1 TaxID=401526 RepID=A1HRT3_9FIRM|nr:endospore germination permease [Thermosinus carboxydivorans]EAX47254.1 spore germination protein [Thermosinus carboxydivorans Nor1]